MWKRIKKVELGEGIEPVYIQALPASVFVNRKEGDALEPVDLVARSLCDENCNPLSFGKDEVLTIPLVDFNTIVKAVLDLNGMVDAEKNSGGQTAK